jgi:hypothetical protein
MKSMGALRCDGCGQPADAEHIARRLRRLEWATRFRPVHIQKLLLAGMAPERDEDFLYSPETKIEGEARNIFEAAQVYKDGKSRDAILVEFQKQGLMLAHVLECPLDRAVGNDPLAAMRPQLPGVLARIRRSLKPKRVLLLSKDLASLEGLNEASLGCPVFTDEEDGEFQIQRGALAGDGAL